MTEDEREAYEADLAGEMAAEEEYEMLAAFGPGVEVVDIITGQRWITGKGRIN